MKLTMKTLLAAALGAAISLPAAAASMSKSEYQEAKRAAEAQYEVERSRCKDYSHDDREVCVKQAKAVREAAEANANASYKGTVEARAEGKEDVAKAEYRAQMERCEALRGNEHELCEARAKADRKKAEADAKSEAKVDITEYRTEKAKDKADYKVARAECDKFAGNVKDRCVAEAKQRYQQ